VTGSWPDVAVAMPVREEAEDLEVAVRAVLAQDYEGRLEVCIAVAPSLDGTLALASHLATQDDRVLVVENPDGGTPAGLNRAIRASTAPIVVRVDGHSRLEQGYIARAVETLKRTGAVNVGGIQEPRGRTLFEVSVGRAMASRFGAGDSRFHYGGAEGAVDTVYLGVFQRDAIEAVGLFDETLVRNQDYELNWRLRAVGGTVWFDPELRVGYRPRGSLHALIRQFFEYGRWKCEVVRRHPRSLRWRQVVPPLTSVALAAGLAGGFFWRPLLVLPITYVALVMVMAVAVGRSIGESVRLVVVYPAIHMSWGFGFLSRIVTNGSREPNEPL